MFSKSCEYGIKAVLYIAHMSAKGQRVGMKEIAHEIDSPEAFTAKIMQSLSKSKIVTSTKGPNGGFEMTQEQRQSHHIRSIVEVLDGPDLYTKCGLGLQQCNDENPCPMHHQYKALRVHLIQMHTNINIDMLADKLNTTATLK